MKRNSVKLNAVGEENHSPEDTVGKACSLGCCSLAFILEEIWKALEAHDLEESVIKVRAKQRYLKVQL